MRNYGIFDEWLAQFISLLEMYGWYVVFALIFMYYFEIPKLISKLPGKIDDALNGEARKKVLDQEVRRIRKAQQMDAHTDRKND